MISFDSLREAAAVTFSNGVYDELYFLEVDTSDSHSAKDKLALVAALEKAKKRGAQMAMKLDDPIARKYLKNNALPNLIDIAQDQNNGRLAKAASNLRNKL